MTIQTKLAATAASWTARAIALAVLIGALVWLWSSWNSGQTAKVEAKLSGNQVEAATASGRDAVETIGERADREAATDRMTRENRDEILQADGADAPVDSDVAGAGLRSLCKRAAYRDNEQCLQRTPAR